MNCTICNEEALEEWRHVIYLPEFLPFCDWHVIQLKAWTVALHRLGVIPVTMIDDDFWWAEMNGIEL